MEDIEPKNNNYCPNMTCVSPPTHGCKHRLLRDILIATDKAEGVLGRLVAVDLPPDVHADVVEALAELKTALDAASGSVPDDPNLCFYEVLEVALGF